ncbi:unnamed protein product [Euphydryas editha]|uniref:Uncharacterized protein n=1 Tax=Euphydryas editha TaxID=104508 RepID=A0AAU9U7V6_EUPED|nr:unnamed protein product [Euphydryas editha]
MTSSDNPINEKPTSDKSYVVGTWPTSTPGHTGYLTVATLPPTFIRNKSSDQSEERSNEVKTTDNGEKANANPTEDVEEMCLDESK